MKLFIKTFGCQMNISDSLEMLRSLQPYGFEPVETQEQADLVVLNTCTVRQHAEDKAYSFIGRLLAWKKEKPGRSVIVAGCAAERTKKFIQNLFPHIDLVVGAKSIDSFSDRVGRWILTRYPELNRRKSLAPFNWFNESENAFGQGNLRARGPAMILGDDRTLYITIMRGCNYSCSYCIVPAVRGREIYRPLQDILQEIRARAKIESGEVMLLGQTVNSYHFEETSPNGQKRRIDFAQLLADLHEMEEVRSIRFMSPHPYYMPDHLIKTLGSSPKISPQIHLPVQSGSNKILKAMKRNYTREDYVAIAGKLRAQVLGLELSTDFIVGFPGESEDDFAQTMALAAELKFNAAYCFKYSVRKGTEAENYADQVPENLREERLERLLNLMEKIKNDKLTLCANA